MNKQHNIPAGYKYTILKQVCNLIPSEMVTELAEKHGVAEQSRTFTPWSHTVSLVHAQLTHAIGLNDVCDSVYGLWKELQGQANIWEAESGDTLWTLANKSQYGGRGINWSCLWPVQGTRDHGYPDKIKPCDKYDASNLAVPSPNATMLRATIAEKEVSDAMESVIGPLEYHLHGGSELKKKIVEISGEGGTPISYLLTAGHGSPSEIGGQFLTRRFSPTYPFVDYTATWDTMTVADLLALESAPTFVRASQRKGPSRCWFTRDSTAIFAGCSTSGYAQKMASKILRIGAQAVGADRMTWWGGGNLSWDWDASTGAYGGTTTSWLTAPVWIRHDGTM
jgi:hypothetical protein